MMEPARRRAAQNSATRRPTDAQSRLLFPASGAFLILAMLLGGAGVEYPILNGIIDGVAVALLFVCLNSPARPAPRPNWLLRATIAAILFVPLVQLIPLPLKWWSALPGRAEAVLVLTAAGIPLTSHPLSLTPEATLESGLGLLPGLAIFAALLRLAPAHRARLLTIVLGAALLTAILGALQKATGGDNLLLPFATAHGPSGPGLFVNRNHQAAFLLASMPLAAVRGSLTGGGVDLRSKLISLALIIVFAGGAVVTTSRMGLVMLPLSFLLSLLILLEPRVSLRTIGIGLILCAALAWLGLQSSGIQATIARFTGTDIRYQYWQDAFYGARHYWPAGAGLGSFSTLFPRFESLSAIDTTYVYNAHNDYVELLFEAGLLGVVAGLLFVALLAQQISRLLLVSVPRRSRLTALSGLVTIIVLMLHSIVDYPLRMASCLTLFGFAAGLLVAATEDRAPNSERRRP